VAGSDNRTDARATTSMRIKLKYPDVETFIQKYAVNISRGGIFIATKQPKPTGTVVRFEFLLGNAEQTSLIRGEGVVQWTREYDPSTPTKAHGMGVKFTRLDAESQMIVDRALQFRAGQGGRRGDSEGITVAQAVPAGATPEPMPLPTREDDEPTSMRASPPPRPRRSFSDDEPPTRPSFSDDEPPTRNVALPEARALPTERALPPLDDEEPARRGATEPTREVHVTDEKVPAGRAREQETRPVQLPDAPGGDTTGEIALQGAVPTLTATPSLDDSVRIALSRHRQPRNGRHHGDELDQLITDWNLSLDRVEKLIKRKRPRIGAQATAELERLLRKPPKPPSVTKTEAIRLLDALLSRRVDESGPLSQMPSDPQAQAAGGEPEASPKRRKRR